MTDLQRGVFEMLWFHCCFFGFYGVGTNRGIDDALDVLRSTPVTG